MQTTESIDKAITAHLSKASTKQALAPAADPKAKIKAIWVIAKPILEMAKGLLFWKPKWVQVINDFELAMDAVYG